MIVRKGTLKGFNAGSYTATVQIAGSLSVWLADVPVARNIDAAEMVIGRHCALIFFSESDPRDALVVGVYT
ncbi:MAG: hypothetical protein AMJ77_06375 [Dehalococcoidia bacterium SM23_28_2]|nr:MAG: hypothetical protein AMJ77_06375 [Dehalococcoidia bacterium SM23_28_2]